MTHHIWLLVGNDKLYQHPKQEMKRVLDVGTGTGIWAIDFADEHPEAYVIGVDLSPIQPVWVPPNSAFEVDDLEKGWTFTLPFDFIFFRSMIGSFRDWKKMVFRAFQNLEPGGYVEIQDNLYPLLGNDDTIQRTNILRWSELMVKAADAIGRPINVARDFKSMLAEAGFVDIVETKERVPMNRWPKDRRYKELGQWSCEMLSRGLEGISMDLLTRGLDMPADEVHVLLAGVRQDLLNTAIHGYWDTYGPSQTKRQV
ncbi:methyltransferase [Bombardia bombarda]|uniref:Methyltransferase n=1 Tax=Bombardia bombarda TaxID=252184 RepID=A0AA39WGT9_9PEZI|nr:methyltransferase [Bombardia bombarda]